MAYFLQPGWNNQCYIKGDINELNGKMYFAGYDRVRAQNLVDKLNLPENWNAALEERRDYGLCICWEDHETTTQCNFVLEIKYESQNSPSGVNFLTTEEALKKAAETKTEVTTCGTGPLTINLLDRGSYGSSVTYPEICPICNKQKSLVSNNWGFCGCQCTDKEKSPNRIEVKCIPWSYTKRTGTYNCQFWFDTYKDISLNKWEEIRQAIENVLNK